MAVAAQLSLLRGLSSSRTAPPTVVYEDAKLAAKEPRVEFVANTLNSLEALSLCDPALIDLAAPLLLKDSLANRNTLDRERNDVVSNAVVVFAHRIAPSFPTRATQRALEWIVRGIEVGRLGNDAEVDALMVAALPFSSSVQFVRLTHALLAPQHSGGKSRSKWAWLQPIIEQKRRPAPGFITRNISDGALRYAIEMLASSAVAGIPINHLAGFLAFTIASRLLSSKASSKLNRRTLALHCLEAICFKRNKFTTLTGKRKKKEAFSPDAQRQLNRAKISFFIALSTAVAGNALEDDVSYAVLHAAVQTLTSITAVVQEDDDENEEKDDAIVETAAGCIIICVGRSGEKAMPFPMAKSLAKWGKFAETLESMTEKSHGTHRTYEAYLLALASQAPENRKAHKALISGLKVRRKALLSDAIVENVLCNLLEAFSGIESCEEEEEDNQSRAKSLAVILEPIARGAWAPGMDAALRRHFDERKVKKKKDRKRYVVVDIALGLALANTPYVTVKTELSKSDGDSTNSLSEYTLISCLDHPEPVVRISGIKRLAAEDSFTDEVRHRFRDVMLRRIEGESDLRVVTEALRNNLVLKFCEKNSILEGLAKQYREALSKLSEKKKNNLPSRIRNFVDAAEECITAIGESSEKLGWRCNALLLGWEVAGIRIAKENTLVSALQKKRFERTTLSTISSLFKWDSSWGLRAVEKIYEEASSTEAGTNLSVVTPVVELCLSCSDLSAAEKSVGTQAVLLCLKNLAKVDAKKYVSIKNLWAVLASEADENALKAFVMNLSKNLGADKLTTLLIESSQKLKTDRARAVSLLWAAVPVKAGKSRKNVDTLVQQVLRAFYSKSPLLQKAAMGICKQINRDDSLEGISEDELVVFQAMESVARSNGIQAHGDQEVSGEANLRTQLLKTLPGLKDLPRPLRAVEATESALVYSVFELAKFGMKTSPSFTQSNGFISHLRALDGLVAGSAESFHSVVDALREMFAKEDGKLIMDTEINVESFVRLVSLIPTNVTAKTDISGLVPLVKALVGRTREMHDSSLTPLLALFGEGLSAALLKCAKLMRRKGATTEIEGLANDAVDAIFSLSTQASSIGEFTNQALSGGDDIAVQQEDFERITNRLWNERIKVSVQKRRRTPARKCARRTEPVEVAEYESVLPEELRRTSITGALEVLTRRRVPGIEAEDHHVWPASPEVQTNLWGFVRICAEAVRESKVGDLSENEYQLSLVLRILTIVSANIELEPDDAMAVVDICFYPGLREDVELTATSRTLRSAAVGLVQELSKSNSSTLSAQIVPFLKHVLESEATDSRRECLAIIVPSLMEGGLSVSELMKVSLEANPSMALPTRMNVTDCIRMCDDTGAATSAALKLILSGDKKNKDSSSGCLSFCVKTIMDSGNSAKEILDVLASMKDDAKLAKISIAVLGQPHFMQALDATLSAEKEGSQELRELLIGLDESFTNLFQVLLRSEDQNRQKALVGLIGIVPGTVLCNCIRIALGDTDKKMGLRAIQSVLKLLEWSTDITNSWIPEEENEKSDDFGNIDSTPSFVTRMCEELKLCINECFEKALDSAESAMVDIPQLDLGKHAIQTLQKVVNRWKPQSIEVVQECGTLLTELVKCMKIEEDGDVLAVVLTCLATIGRALGPSGSIFVPTLTGVIADVIERVLYGENENGDVVPKSNNAKIPVLNEAVSAAKEVLDFAPKMFGKKSLRRISAVAALSGRESVVQLIYTAVQKVPVVQAIDALEWSLQSATTARCDAASGVTIVLGGVGKLLETMKKKEVMMHRAPLFKVLLSALDFRRKMATGLLGNGEKKEKEVEEAKLMGLVGARDEMEKCRKVETACFDTIVDMVLRLPESKFKELFNHIVVWSESAELSEADQDKLEGFKIDCVPSVLRLIPLLGLSLVLFSKMGKIMVPYFAEILERTLVVVGSNEASLWDLATIATEQIGGSGSKRKRTAVELGESMGVASGMENMRRGAVKQGLRNVETFMRVMPEMDSCSAETFTAVQSALLEAFDAAGEASQELRLAVAAMAQRMLVTDTDRTKEQCRTLICGLSRSILARTRSEEAKTRSAAIALVDNVLDAVGDEYLPALPEAMPVLADVIDDENDEVARATKEFVRKMELITGQSILEQLKG